MKKLFTLLFLSVMGLCAFNASAQSSTEDFETAADVKQIAPLQWTLTWTDYLYAEPMWYVSQYPSPDYLAFVTNLSTNQKEILKYGTQIIRTDFSNYITVRLDGMNLPDGKYEIFIPEGYLNLVPGGGLPYETNVAQYVEIEIGSGQTFEYEPYLDVLDNVVDIYWQNVTQITPANTNGAYITNVRSGQKYEMYYLKDYEFTKANLRSMGEFLRMNITNNYPTLPEGTYRLFLPADYVYFNGTKTGNAEINDLTFDFRQAWNEGQVVFNGPVDNKITATWVQATEVTFNEDYTGDGFLYGKGFGIYDGDDNFIMVSYPSRISCSGNVVTVDISGLNVVNGDVRLVIPDDSMWITVNGVTDLTFGQIYDFVYNDGVPGQGEVNPTYELYKGQPVWSVAMDQDVVTGDNNPVEVYWPNTTIQINYDNNDKVSLYSGELGYFELETGTDVKVSADNTKLIIDLSSLEFNVYRLNVPEALLVVTANNVNYYNTATSVDNLTIDVDSGIESLQAEDGGFMIYNLQGVKVLDTKNANDFNSLPKGLYIVNGKKVMK